MNKISIYDIAGILVEKNGLTKSESEQFVAAMFDVIQEGLEKDGLVKIKGLGTFKIIDVDARESVNVNTGERVVIESHGKVTFTPDAVMKELVNKPFSLFETVVLNDGIDFDDVPGNGAEETLGGEVPAAAPAGDSAGQEPQESAGDVSTDSVETAAEEPSDTETVVEEGPRKEETPDDTNEQAPSDDDGMQETDGGTTVTYGSDETADSAEDGGTDAFGVSDDSSEDDETATSDESSGSAEYEETESSDESGDSEDESSDSEEPAVTEENEATEPAPADEMTRKEEAASDGGETNGHARSRRVWPWIVFTAVSAVLVVLSFYVGYRYGSDNVTVPEPKTKVIVKRVIVHVPDTLPNKEKDSLAQAKGDTASYKKDDKTAAHANEKAAKTEADRTENVDFAKYAAKDVRVRTGAYSIVGTDRIWTVRKGETISSISRRALGEGMACYIEVYNDLNANSELKEGQKIKIPKLKLKRKSGK